MRKWEENIKGKIERMSTLERKPEIRMMKEKKGTIFFPWYVVKS